MNVHTCVPYLDLGLWQLPQLLPTPTYCPTHLLLPCRLLMNSLPSVEELETGQLPQLAQLHLSSAASLMTTIRLLAPSAFAEGASSPDEQLLSLLDCSLLNMVSCLIDLQLFHLQRAALLAARSRRCSKQTRNVSSLGRSCSTGYCSKSAQADL